MGILTPTLSERRPAQGERIASATAPGASTIPVAAGESPLTCETRSGTMTKHETLTSMERNPTLTAATYLWFMIRVGETKGCVAFVIRQANPSAARAAAAK